MKRLLRPSYRLVLLSTIATPITAFGQMRGAEAGLVQSSQTIPEAKTWHVDDDGNFVVITQQQLVELAQTPAPSIAWQAMSDGTSEAVTIPAGMFSQIIMYSAGIGGLAGGTLIGSLMHATSRGKAADIDEVSNSDSLNHQATLLIIDQNLSFAAINDSLTYELHDQNGIYPSDLMARLADIEAFDPVTININFEENESTISIEDQYGVVNGKPNAYTSIRFKIEGQVDQYLNPYGDFSYLFEFLDADGNNEEVNFLVTFGYGDFFSAFGAYESIAKSDAANTLVFGDYAASFNGSQLLINGGGGNDVMTFGDYAAYADGDPNGGTLEISNSDGDQEYNFGNGCGQYFGELYINVSNGNHSFSVGAAAGLGGDFHIIAGNGDQVAEFGSQAGAFSGHVSLHFGDGNHDIIFGQGVAEQGMVEIELGTGSSSLTFGENAAANSGSIRITLGAGAGIDTLDFKGLVGNISIQNYSIDFDNKIDVVIPTTWSGYDDGSNISFVQGSQSITFEGLGGISSSLDPLDYFI